MNQQQFQEEEAPRSQRMTEDEAKAVIDLWQQECVEDGGLTTSPAVQDVAEGLDISVADVQRLLRKVRTRRTEEGEYFRREQDGLDPVQQRLADEERQLASVRREWERTRRRQAERKGRLVEQLPSAHGISPPDSEELAEADRQGDKLEASERRFRGYLLAGLAALVILVELAASFFH